MGPFEDGELRVIGEPATDGGGATDGGRVESDRFLVEPWLPHQYKWANVATLGLVTGLLGAFIAVQTGSPFLGFGISAASLVFLNCGVEKVPVTHHITLTSSTAALAIVPASTASVPLLPALVVGGAMGIVVALFAEVFQRIFYSHGDTHWDPPAAAIVFGTFLVGVLAMAGVFPQSVWVPLP